MPALGNTDAMILPIPQKNISPMTILVSQVEIGEIATECPEYLQYVDPYVDALAFTCWDVLQCEMHQLSCLVGRCEFEVGFA